MEKFKEGNRLLGWFVSGKVWSTLYWMVVKVILLVFYYRQFMWFHGFCNLLRQGNRNWETAITLEIRNYSKHTLSDTFLALKSCVTQGMSVRFRNIPWVTHVSQKSVTSGEFSTIISAVTHFSIKTCVTKGKIALNFPEVTQFCE